MDRHTCDQLNSIYKDIAENFGVDIAVQMYEQYKGLQISFPVRLLSKDYVERQVVAEYDGKNLKVLAREYGYSERWIRKIIQDAEPDKISGGEK